MYQHASLARRLEASMLYLINVRFVQETAFARSRLKIKKWIAR